jgi:hypothetical protein
VAKLRLMPLSKPVGQRQKLRATGKGPVSTCRWSMTAFGQTMQPAPRLASAELDLSEPESAIINVVGCPKPFSYVYQQLFLGRSCWGFHSLLWPKFLSHLRRG